MIGLGIGIPYTRGGVSAPSLGTTMATTHYNRVIADGGVLPVGISGLASVLDSIIAAYGVTDSTDFNTKVPVFLDPSYTGYKLGAGSGTTLGQAAQKVYSVSSTADVTQTTAASQPLLLAHSGVNYLYTSNAAGNNCTTPAKIVSGYNGEFEIQAKVKPKNLLTGTTQDYAIIFTAGDSGSIALTLIGTTNNRNLGIFRNAGSIGITTSTIDASIFDGWIKAYRTATNIRYETSTDGVNWTLFENVSIVNAGFTITGNSMIGNYSNSDQRGQFSGYIYRVKVWINGSSITGNLTYDFNPSSYSASISQTQWTSTTGEVWTINTGTAANTLRGVLVDRTKTQGLGTISNYCLTSSLNRPLISTSFVAGLFYDNQISYPIYGPSTANLSYAIAYYTNGVRFMTDNSNGAAQISESLNKLVVMTFLNKSGGSNGSINNGTIYNVASSDTGATSTGTGILKGNQIFNTLITSGTESTTLQKTAIYNLIKTMNLL